VEGFKLFQIEQSILCGAFRFAVPLGPRTTNLFYLFSSRRRISRVADFLPTSDEPRVSESCVHCHHSYRLLASWGTSDMFPVHTVMRVTSECAFMKNASGSLRLETAVAPPLEEDFSPIIRLPCEGRCTYTDTHRTAERAVIHAPSTTPHSHITFRYVSPYSVIKLHRHVWGTYKQKNKLLGLSPRTNYTYRTTAASRRTDCQLLRIKGATWSA
jgi:hypothetical protein